MSHLCKLIPLESLGALRVRGRDAVAFLQGQLSADIAKLSAAGSLLAGYHNPQGRVLALLRLIELSPGDVLAVLPRELASPVVKRLAAFILRSKVEVADDSSAWRVEGLVGAAGADTQLPAAPGGVMPLGASFAVRVGEEPARWLIVSPHAAPRGTDAALPGCAPGAPELWQHLAVHSGEPQVYAATSGEFVAQMLNLDVLGAIAFDKGCYTGQEVIARAHYRGRVKRRLQRFHSTEPRMLAPGDAGELTDGRAFRVVEAARASDGGCGFLAVAPLTGGATAGEENPVPAGTLRLNAQPQPLPYELPE